MKAKKEILINANNEESRIAILEDEVLVEVLFESPDNERMVGDIYKGKVGKVLPGMQAAFIDIGMQQDAFLHFSDVGSNYMAAAVDEIEYESIDRSENMNERAVNIARSLKRDQEILVQIVKEPIANKGPRVTTDISLPGRYVVLLTNQRHIGVSKKIYSPKEKRRLQKIAKEYLPDGFGTIIRTAASEHDDESLISDYKYLLKLWGKIENIARKTPAKNRIHKDMDMVDALIRDHFKDDVSRVIIDSRKVWKEIKNYLKDFSPQLLDKLEYYSEKTPLFDKFNIEQDLQKSLEKKVWLKNGGYLFIEHTEALTSIDVNSGRFIGKQDHESNSMKINLEAASEIARQLRLRDIGGIIIIDFIDVENEKNKLKIQSGLINGLKRDKAISKVEEISRFGLIEMTRQRIRPSLIHNMYETCPTCNGNGLVPTMGNIISYIERWLKRYRSKGVDRRLVLVLHPEMADFMLNGFFNKKYELMWKYFIILTIEVSERLLKHEYRFYLKKTGEDITNQIKT